MNEDIETSPRARRIIEAMDLMDSPRLGDKAWVAFVKAHEAVLDREESEEIDIEVSHVYIGGGIWRDKSSGRLLTPSEMLMEDVQRYLEDH
jgi:hypothetical protein